jgi:hypothetical protein
MDRDTEEIIMSPAKRYAQKQAKARQRRRLNAQERLDRDRRQAQQAAEALHQALEELACLRRWCVKSKAAYRANRSC